MPGLFQMRVGVPLSELRYELLAETRQSLNPAQTTSSTPFYNYALNRTQREQWNLIIWPHLVYYEDLPMVAGQRYYAYPAEPAVRQPHRNLVAARRQLGSRSLTGSHRTSTRRWAASWCSNGRPGAGGTCLSTIQTR